MQSPPQIGYSDQELQKIAKEQLYEEEPGQINDDINAIRKWLYEKQYTERTDDTFIIMFLRTCKFKLKKTQEKIEKYYALRLCVLKSFQWKHPSQPVMLEYIKMGICTPLNYNTLTGAKVIIVRLSIIDPWTTNFDDFHNVLRLIIETFTLDKQSQIIGYDIVVDLTDFRISHLGFFTPNVARLYCKFLKAYPLRLKGIHVLKLPVIAYGLYALCKQLLPSKLSKRIHLYGCDFTKLYKQIPSNSFPEEYGGTAGPLSAFIDRNEDAIFKNIDFLKTISIHEEA